MAMIACRECTAEISSEAQMCPQCGARTKPKKKVWRWVLGIPLALFMLMMIFGAIKSDPQKDRARRAYELCKDQLNDPLIDNAAKLAIVRPTCERMRNEFRAKYNAEP